jgi:hypothetical protein
LRRAITGKASFPTAQARSDVSSGWQRPRPQ